MHYSSIISIVLSFISFFIIALYSAAKLVSLFYKFIPPKVSINSFFSEDSGRVSIDPFGLFHFINFKVDNIIKEFDFENLRIIGFETYFDVFMINKNLSMYDHWLYGPCKNESELKEINYLINQEDFRKSACIKKFFNSKEQKYYNTNEDKFRWPTIEQGIINFKEKIYSIIIDKCEDNTFKIIFDDNKGKCKNNLKLEELYKNGYIHFNFIDNQVKTENYTDPIGKFLNKLETKLFKDNHCLNYLYFNPVILDTESDAGKAYDDAVERLLGNEVPLRFVTEKKGILRKIFKKK